MRTIALTVGLLAALSAAAEDGAAVTCTLIVDPPLVHPGERPKISAHLCNASDHAILLPSMVEDCERGRELPSVTWTLEGDAPATVQQEEPTFCNVRTVTDHDLAWLGPGWCFDPHDARREATPSTFLRSVAFPSSGNFHLTFLYVSRWEDSRKTELSYGWVSEDLRGSIPKVDVQCGADLTVTRRLPSQRSPLPVSLRIGMTGAELRRAGMSIRGQQGYWSSADGSADSRIHLDSRGRVDRVTVRAGDRWAAVVQGFDMRTGFAALRARLGEPTCVARVCQDAGRRTPTTVRIWWQRSPVSWHVLAAEGSGDLLEISVGPPDAFLDAIELARFTPPSE